MSETVMELLPTLMQLSAEDREFLAHELMLSLEGHPDEDSPEFRAMLNRRSEEMRQDPSKRIPADVVFARIRERMK